MVESNWTELGGKQVRYAGHTWELSGAVEVRESGELLATEAQQAGDVRGETAMLFFRLENPPDSLNAGHLGEHFDRLERTADGYRLVVKTDPRTYRYELQRMEYV